MKTPIKPEDIRKGDTIRLEWATTQGGTPMAMEYVAPHQGTGMKKRLSGTERLTASWFLLNRPRALLWPRGTHLWLTRDFYPWSQGDQIELERDWFADEADGATTMDGPGGRMYVAASAVTDVRPEPVIDLPTKPAEAVLGILTWRDPDAICSQSQVAEWYAHNSKTVFGGGTGVPLFMVTAFTPATAIPTEALGDLREWMANEGPLPNAGWQWRAAVTDLLAAIDEANGAS